jgi:hypothetical protein
MKSITRILLTSAVAGLALAGVPSPAQAEPTNCTLTPVTKGVEARCTAGSGQVRAGVECFVKNQFESTHYGSWVGVGSVSTARCFGGSRLVDSWYEVA